MYLNGGIMSRNVPASINGNNTNHEENCLLAMNAPQINVNANTVVALVDNIVGVTKNTGISFNNTTHRATLKKGNTYLFQACVRHDGSTTNTWSNYSWYDVTNTTFFGKMGHSPSMDFNTDDSSQPTVSAIITPLTNIEVELRCLSVSTANQSIEDDATHATILKIYNK